MASIQEKKSEMTLSLPNDPKILKTAITNIGIALNKSVKAGVFELKEASQLHNDLTVLSGLTDQVLQSYKETS